MGPCSSKACVVLSKVISSWQHHFLADCAVAVFSYTHTIASIMLQGLVIWQVLHLLISYIFSQVKFPTAESAW